MQRWTGWIWVVALVFPFVGGWLWTGGEVETRGHGGLYPAPLDGPYTGGFGEPTCHSCHFDYDLNPEEGALILEGIPDVWEPGKTYQWKVSVEREDLQKGGFQLSARLKEGEQAGRFEWSSDRITTTPVGDREGVYVQHSGNGTEPIEEGRISWVIDWIAPDRGSGAVYVHIAANAGNGDDSSFGDWIYLADIRIDTSKQNDGS
ncbi:MAG: choice-of-anchor V domain-containing protein [Balneolaceae bacterium]